MQVLASLTLRDVNVLFFAFKTEIGRRGSPVLRLKSKQYVIQALN